MIELKYMSNSSLLDITPWLTVIKFILVKVVNEKKLQSEFKSAQRERAVDNQIYKYVCQAQKALYDLDSQNDITQPDNPLYWPKGAVKDLSQDDPKEKEDFEELELLKQNPLISNQIIHKRVPGKKTNPQWFCLKFSRKVERNP